MWPVLVEFRSAPRTNEEAKPQILPIFTNFRTGSQKKLAPPFATERKIKNLKQYCQSLTIVVHGDTNLVGVGPQTREIDALVYVWGGKILRNLANTALYL